MMKGVEGSGDPELLRQHPGKKHQVAVSGEELKRVTHAINDSPTQIFPTRSL